MPTLVIFGGRDFTDYDAVEPYLIDAVRKHEIDKIVTGGARGADSIGRMFAIRNDIAYSEIKADWKKYGLAAGPHRNQLLLDTYSPRYGFCMRGGVGSKDMYGRCKAAGVEIIFDMNGFED